MSILTSPYLIVPLIAWVVSQLVKLGMYSYLHDADVRVLYRIGGTPSSRIAVVSSLVFTALIVDGIQSAALGTTVIVMMIVLYDAFSPRPQFQKLDNWLGSVSQNIDNRRFAQRPVLRLSRTVWSVIGGVLVGIFVASALSFNEFREFTEVLSQYAPLHERRWYQYAYLGAMVTALIATFILMRPKLRRLPTSIRIRNLLGSNILLPGVIGLIFVWLQAESVGLFQERLWHVVTLVWIAIGVMIVYVYGLSGFADRVKEERAQLSELKALRRKKSKKKRKKRR